MSLVLTIRPEPGCSATVEAGRAAGLSIDGCPLFQIRPLAWEAPPAESIDGLLLGSANAVRHGGASLERYRGAPVYAVGSATAAAAEAAGFTVAAIGRGVLQDLVDTLAPPLRLLRLTGAEHVPLAPPRGIEVIVRVGYESASQFSRDFKRLFGRTPLAEVAWMKQAYALPAPTTASPFVSSH